MNIGHFFASDMAWLRRSRWRVSILRSLLTWDNRLRAWITYFSFEDGIHPKHRITQYHQFFLDHLKSTDTVLDIGCGLGLLANEMAAKAQSVIGIDIDAPSLKYARKHFSKPNLHFIEGDALTYTFSEKVTTIVLSNVLEHIQDRVNFLKQLKPIAPTILIRVPMIDRDWIVLLKHELGVEYRLDPTHFTEFTEEQFRYEITQAGYSIESLAVKFGEIYAVLKA